MVKITSKSWVEKDDPMFTGRFTVHSVRAKQSVKKKVEKHNRFIKKIRVRN